MKIFKILPVIISAGFIFTALLYAGDFDMSAQELFSFGESLLKQGKYVEAKGEFEKCLSLNPGFAEAKKELTVCEEKLGGGKEKAMLSAMENLEKESKAESAEISKEEGNAAALEKQEEASEKGTATAQEPELTKEEETLVPPVVRGAWTLKKGQLYTELYNQYYWDDAGFNNGREKNKWAFDGKYKDITSELKLEYGLTDDYTLLLYSWFRRARWKDDFNNSTKKAFIRIEPGVKRLLFTEPFIGTLQVKAKFPLDTYDQNASPSLDQHQIDIETRFLTAQPWPKLPGYTKFELGFTYRAQKPSNEIPYYFEFGYNLFPFMILKTSLDGKTAVGGGTKEDWLVYTVGPIFKIKDLLNIEFGFGDTITGRNTSAGKKIFTTLSRMW